MPKFRANKLFPFAPTHKTIEEILIDRDLAILGDAYANLIFSLYLSIKKGRPRGAKADSHTLSQALKQAELREFLPSRVDRHRQADAAEALLVYIWLQDLTTINESVKTLTKHPDVTEGFSELLREAKRKLNL